MDKQLTNYLHDLVILLHDKYNNSLHGFQTEAEEDKSFRLGMNTAYHDVLDLIESQLKVFGFNPNEIGNLQPIMGQNVNLK